MFTLKQVSISTSHRVEVLYTGHITSTYILLLENKVTCNNTNKLWNPYTVHKNTSWRSKLNITYTTDVKATQTYGFHATMPKCNNGSNTVQHVVMHENTHTHTWAHLLCVKKCSVHTDSVSLCPWQERILGILLENNSWSRGEEINEGAAKSSAVTDCTVGFVWPLTTRDATQTHKQTLCVWVSVTVNYQ